MENGLLGEIRMFAGNFAPKCWAFCAGQMMEIRMNLALFSVVQTWFGGDGKTTFALPDFQGRNPIGACETIPFGQNGGEESITLSVENLPAHTHAAQWAATSTVGSQFPYSAGVPASIHAKSNTTGHFFQLSTFGSVAGGDNMAADVVQVLPSGAGKRIDLQNPYAAVNFIICLIGQYPNRA